MTAPKLFKSNDELHRLLATLRLLGAHSVAVEFSGGGDSGGITDTTYYDSGQGPLMDETFTKAPYTFTSSETRFDHDKGIWVTESKERTGSLHDAVIDMVYNALAESSVDYINNDGGYGTFHISFDADQPTLSLEMYERFTKVMKHSYSFNAETIRMVETSVEEENDY